MINSVSHLRVHLIIFFACLLQIGIPGESIADINEAYEAWKQGDYETAYREYSILAEQGDAEAQFALGNLYNRGEGVTRDPAKVAAWFKKAAEQGHPKAQTRLGELYRSGRGVPRNPSQAVYWIRQAAQQDYALAQIILGEMYAQGKDVKRNDCLAVEWYQKAVNQGDALAQYKLALMYLSGSCLPQGGNKAFMLMELAAKQGYGVAQIQLANMYRTGYHVSQDFEKAQHWYRVAGADGSLMIMCRERQGNLEGCPREVIWRGIREDVGWLIYLTLALIALSIPLAPFLLLSIGDQQRGKILAQMIIFVVVSSSSWLLVTFQFPLVFVGPYVVFLIELYAFYKGHGFARVILGLLFLLAVPAWFIMLMDATIGPGKLMMDAVTGSGSRDKIDPVDLSMFNIVLHFIIAMMLFFSPSIKAFQAAQRLKSLDKK